MGAVTPSRRTAARGYGDRVGSDPSGGNGGPLTTAGRSGSSGRSAGVPYDGGNSKRRLPPRPLASMAAVIGELCRVAGGEQLMTIPSAQRQIATDSFQAQNRSAGTHRTRVRRGEVARASSRRDPGFRGKAAVFTAEGAVPDGPARPDGPRGRRLARSMALPGTGIPVIERAAVEIRWRVPRSAPYGCRLAGLGIRQESYTGCSIPTAGSACGFAMVTPESRLSVDTTCATAGPAKALNDGTLPGGSRGRCAQPSSRRPGCTEPAWCGRAQCPPARVEE